jgi:precorrin-6Y C5,15-methyltransferase (decarboxylating)
VFWDLGAGSGSVSIEAALFIKKGSIFAVEKNTERIAQIKENRNRFGVENLHIVQSDLPDGLETLPRPDRIFIGGGGQGLERIINAASAFLRPDGLVVVNTVLLENVNISRKTLQGLGYRTDVVQVQINRSSRMPWGERMDAQNPVWIVTGEKAQS